MSPCAGSGATATTTILPALQSVPALPKWTFALLALGLVAVGTHWQRALHRCARQ